MSTSAISIPETGRPERQHRGGQSVRNSLKEKGYRFTLLRVSMAFHSPIMRVIHDELEAYVASIPFHSPHIPVISNTTRAPYPSDPGEIRRILMATWNRTSIGWRTSIPFGMTTASGTSWRWAPATS